MPDGMTFEQAAALNSGNQSQPGPTTQPELQPVDRRGVAEDAHARAMATYNDWRDRGYSINDSLAMTANAHVESKNKPATINGIGAEGQYQWLGPRLERYIARYGHPPSQGTIAENNDFAHWENQNTESQTGWAAVQAARDSPYAKAKAFRTHWERPATTPEGIAKEEASVEDAVHSLIPGAMQQEIMRGKNKLASLRPATDSGQALSFEDAQRLNSGKAPLSFYVAAMLNVSSPGPQTDDTTPFFSPDQPASEQPAGGNVDETSTFVTPPAPKPVQKPIPGDMIGTMPPEEQAALPASEQVTGEPAPRNVAPWKWGLDPNEPLTLTQPPPTPPQSMASSTGRAAVQGAVEGVGRTVAGMGQFQIAHDQSARMVAMLNLVDQGKIQEAVRGATPIERAQLSQYLKASPDQRQEFRGAKTNALIETGDAIKEAAKNVVVDPANEGNLTDLARGAGSIVSLLPAMGVGAVVGGPAGAALPLLQIGAQSYDSRLEHARAAGAPDEVAREAASIDALTQMGIMALPFGQVLSRSPKLANALFDKIIDAGKHGVSFASFNALATFAGNVIAQQEYKPDQELSEGVAKSAAHGLLLGTAMGAPGVARAIPEVIQNRRLNKALDEAFGAAGRGPTPEPPSGPPPTTPEATASTPDETGKYPIYDKLGRITGYSETPGTATGEGTTGAEPNGKPTAPMSPLEQMAYEARQRREARAAKAKADAEAKAAPPVQPTEGEAAPLPVEPSAAPVEPPAAAPPTEAAPAPAEPPKPTRIRTIQEIMDQDGVNAKQAKATQQEEILALSRPITDEERVTRTNNNLPPPAEAAPPDAAPPETPPQPPADQTPQPPTVVRPDSPISSDTQAARHHRFWLSTIAENEQGIRQLNAEIARGEHTPEAGQKLIEETQATIERARKELGRNISFIDGSRYDGGGKPEDQYGDKPAAPTDQTPKPAIGSFTTSKGSTYEFHDDGTTTRNKSYHPEHGEKDQGPQPRSQATVFVTPEQADALSLFQTQGGGPMAIHRLPDGRIGVKYLDGKDAGKFERRTVVMPQTEPAVGLMPVEIWNGGTRVHFGNEITEVRPPAEAKPTEAASAAPTQPTPPPDTRPGRDQLPPADQPAPEHKTDTVYYLKPDDLTVDPKLMQYKEADEQGVTGVLKGVKRWESSMGDPLTLWQRRDGTLVVVNGHQRTDLAKRAQADGQKDIEIRAEVYREADGDTAPFMRAIGAYKNIGQGSGTAIDAAKVLRGSLAIPPGRRLPELPPGGELVVQGRALAKLSDEAFGMVTNEIVPAAYAAHVGELISDPAQQMVALGELAKDDPGSSNRARIMVQDIKDSGYAEEMERRQTELPGIGGGAPPPVPLFKERARVLDYAQNLLGNLSRVFKTAVKGEETLTAAGNTMDAAANEKARKENAEFLAVLKRDGTKRGPISDALNAAARELAEGQPITAVGKRFLTAAREAVRSEGADRSGENAGLRPGDSEYRERPESEGEPDPGPGLGLEQPPDLFGNSTPERAKRQAEATIRNDPRQQSLLDTKPSAIQAQKARDAAGPRSDQKPMDQGLFARPEREQPSLIPERPAERPPEPPPAPAPEPPKVSVLMPTSKDAPGVRDMMDTVPHKDEGPGESRDWVIQKGKETGHEHLTLVDRDGNIVHASTAGSKNSAPVAAEAMIGMPADSVTIHHNHPSSIGLTCADIGLAAIPQVGAVVAHGHDGNTYIVKVKSRAGVNWGPGDPADRTALAKQATELRLAHKIAVSRIQKFMQEMFDRGLIDHAGANKSGHDLASRILHASGDMDYVTTQAVPEAIRPHFERLLRSIVGDVPSGRFTGHVRPDEAIAGLHQGDRAAGEGVGGRPARTEAGPQGVGPEREVPERQPPAPNGQGERGPGPAPESRPEGSAPAPVRKPRQGTLFEPGVREDPDLFDRVPPGMRMAGRGVVANVKAVTQSIRDGFSPIQAGTHRAMAWASDFANSLRGVEFRFGQIDKQLEREFKPSERDAMGRALDNQSVFEQRVAAMPEAERDAARAEFDAGRTGLTGLDERQRAAVEMLNDLSADTWETMREVGMVAPTAEGLPYYFPRQMVTWTDEAGYGKARGEGGFGRGIDARGKELTTRGPMSREHLTPEETEAAARYVVGDDAFLLRDIRSLPNRLAYAHRAIAGRRLIEAVERIGNLTGVNMVLRGDEIPDLLPGREEREYFTMADHPAFQEWSGQRGAFRPIRIAKEFEGPLKAVLTKPPPEWYLGLSKLKSYSMRSIMFSPLMHLVVELGRSMPVDPIGVMTGRTMINGNRLIGDVDYMSQAIKDGIAPIGQGWHKDIGVVTSEAFPEQRTGFMNTVREWWQGVADKAGPPGSWKNDILRHPHQTILWDSVFKLQMGLYDKLRTKWIADGFEPEAAGTMAAHIANRYAGALPPEHLSQGANMAANMLLFSRSFTLGNLGVIKDMFTGAPPQVLARIEQMIGTERTYSPDNANIRHPINLAKDLVTGTSAQTTLRRKAISAYAFDVGLFYLGNALLQSGVNALLEGLEDTQRDFVRNAITAVSETASGNPFGIFKMLPQMHNEPGKTDRIYIGKDSNGRGIYWRMPGGKVGEEMIGWLTHPGTMAVNKASPWIRPAIEMAIGYDTLGRQVLPPHPENPLEWIESAGIVIQNMLLAQFPRSFIEGSWDLLVNQAIRGRNTGADPGVNAAKILGPLTGMAQISGGYPGGPLAGEIHGMQEKQRYISNQAMPAIRDMILNGEEEKAREKMRELHIPPKLANYYVTQTKNPTHITKARRRMLRDLPPDKREQYGLDAE